jgi:hypothetical protein
MTMIVHYLARRNPELPWERRRDAFDLLVDRVELEGPAPARARCLEKAGEILGPGLQADWGTLLWRGNRPQMQAFLQTIGVDASVLERFPAREDDLLYAQVECF